MAQRYWWEAGGAAGYNEDGARASPLRDQDLNSRMDNLNLGMSTSFRGCLHANSPLCIICKKLNGDSFLPCGTSIHTECFVAWCHNPRQHHWRLPCCYTECPKEMITALCPDEVLCHFFFGGGLSQQVALSFDGFYERYHMVKIQKDFRVLEILLRPGPHRVTTICGNYKASRTYEIDIVVEVGGRNRFDVEKKEAISDYIDSMVSIKESQYSVGSSSACTVICCEAATLIHHGAALDESLLLPSLRQGSDEHLRLQEVLGGDRHTDVGEVVLLSERYAAEWNPFLQQFGVTGSPENFRRIVKAIIDADETRSGVSYIILTKPPETVLIYLNFRTTEFAVFDSHTRVVGVEQVGAALYRFATLDRLFGFLNALMQHVDMGFDAGQDGMYNQFEASGLSPNTPGATTTFDSAEKAVAAVAELLGDGKGGETAETGAGGSRSFAEACADRPPGDYETPPHGYVAPRITVEEFYSQMPSYF